MSVKIFNLPLFASISISSSSSIFPITPLSIAIDNGVIGKIEDDDEIEIDANNGKLNILTDISKRKNSLLNDMKKSQSFGRNIFNTLRIHSQGSEEGGGIKLID